MLADSSNGYTCDFNVYIGKAAGRNVSVNGLAYDVVMNLMQPFLHQRYHLCFDTFYTSFPLVKDLYQLGVPSTGTMIENRREFPPKMGKGKVSRKHEVGKNSTCPNPSVEGQQSFRSFSISQVLEIVSGFGTAETIIMTNFESLTTYSCNKLCDYLQYISL